MVGPGSETRVRLDPYSVAGGFLAYCIAQGWVEREGSGRGSAYYVTRIGCRELESRFGIIVRHPPWGE
jgi:hypothetical protein